MLGSEEIAIPVLRLHVARRFMSRLLGLHVAPFQGDRQGLMITPCRVIHSFGLKMPIDVVFLDREHKVIHCLRSLSPNRIAGIWRAHSVVELPGGYCIRHADWAQRVTRACTEDLL